MGGCGDEWSYIAPDFDMLYRELGDLRSELASLFEELEFINRVVIPRTQTNYLIKVGALRVDLLQTQVSVMKTRRKIALLRSNIDKGETMFDDAINYKVETEFKEWDARLSHEVAQIERAKARFSSLVPAEDENEIRVVFRTLCRKLNPEINPDQSDEAKSFWPSVYSSYAGSDLFHLKALLLMSDDYPDSYDLPSDVGAMRESRTTLKEKIGRMRAQLQNAKSHPAFEWMALLQDGEQLAIEQNRLRDEIARMKAQRVALLDMQKSLELRGARR
jgi:regulator of replication initiation timing